MTDAKSHFPRPIILVGFMASGKTSVGRRLAEKLAVPFVDTDHEIEKRVQKPIHEFFLKSKESVFRDLEADVLKNLFSLYKDRPVVMATGGGILSLPENQALILGKSFSVHLQTSFAEISRRVHKRETYHQFLWNRPFDETLYEQRKPLYALAQKSISTDGKTVEEIVDEIIRGAL